MAQDWTGNRVFIKRQDYGKSKSGSRPWKEIQYSALLNDLKDRFDISHCRLHTLTSGEPL